MEAVDKWSVVHAYRKLSAIGAVPTVVCPEDEEEMVPAVGENAEPVWKCLRCLSIFGIDIWQIEAMQRNMKEANG